MRRILILLMVCAGLLAGPAFAQKPPLVAASSDLRFALPEIAAAFKAQIGETVALEFGATGTLAGRIEKGASFELFLSAEESYVERLAGRGLTFDRGRRFAEGKLAVFAARGSPVQPDAALESLRSALDNGSLRRLAIANPEYSAHGQAAREVLLAAGLWKQSLPHLLLEDDSGRAADAAASGSAQVGIIPLSLALAPSIASRGAHAPIPEAVHSPLHHRMVLLKNPSLTARRFFAFMLTPAAAEILERHGFDPPAREPL